MPNDPVRRTVTVTAPGCEPIVVNMTIAHDPSCFPEPYKAKLQDDVRVGSKMVAVETLLGSGQTEPRAMADLLAMVLETLWE